MADDLTKTLGRWQPGQTGNASGRPPKNRILTELLRLRGNDTFRLEDGEITAQEALARAIWHFVVTGEVQLAGKHLIASSVTEWASVVKWLYTYVEPPKSRRFDIEPEVVVRIVRVDKQLPRRSDDNEDETP